MNYKKYQNARDAAWQILIDCKVNSLPVDVLDVCRRLKITVKEFHGTAENDGYSLFVNGKPVIFASDQVSPERMRFTIAHELGHIVLNHVGQHELVNREPSDTDNPIEHEANVFASRLLAPACVLWGCNAHTAAQIALLCGISYQSAVIRAERMELLYKRNRFLTSPEEKKVYKQFARFIDKNWIIAP